MTMLPIQFRRLNLSGLNQYLAHWLWVRMFKNTSYSIHIFEKKIGLILLIIFRNWDSNLRIEYHTCGNGIYSDVS